MNVRKNIDYSELFAAIDKAVRAALPQMKLYWEIGRLVCERSEKGAAVAVAEHLRAEFPNARGFSPRNVRRMREFYRSYTETPTLLDKAMCLGWTQNVVILEADLSLTERAWYIHAALQNGWSKLTLAENIDQCAHNKDAVPNTEDSLRYTASEDMNIENCDDRDFWKPGLSAYPTQATWIQHRLCRQNGPPVGARGLYPIRSLNRHGPGKPPGQKLHLRRRPGGKQHLLLEYAGSPDSEVHRPVVHSRFRSNLVRC